MKILFGSIVTDARGRLNGHVFKKTAFGNSITRLALPRARFDYQKNKALQTMARLLAQWKIYDDAEKQNWELFAQQNPQPNAFGVLRNIGGRAMYVKCSWSANYPDPEPLSSDIIHNELPAVDFGSASYSNTTGKITVNLAYLSADTILALYVCKTNGNATRPPQSKFRRIANVLFVSAGAQVSATDIRTILGSDFTNSKLWLKYQIVNDVGYPGAEFVYQIPVAP